MGGGDHFTGDNANATPNDWPTGDRTLPGMSGVEFVF